MKRNFHEPITDVAGNAVEQDGRPVRLADIAMNALLANQQGATAEQKYKSYVLATRIHGSEDGQVEVSAEEVAMLKDLIGKGYGPLVVGRAFDLLEKG